MLLLVNEVGKIILSKRVDGVFHNYNMLKIFFRKPIKKYIFNENDVFYLYNIKI